MIEALTGFPETVVAFICKDHVTKQDYDSVLIPAVEHALAQHKKIRVYYHIDASFSEIEPGAIWDDFKVGIVHLFRWDRLAVVTDVEWIRSTLKAFSFGLPCEARLFRLEEVAEARTWIVEGISP